MIVYVFALGSKSGDYEELKEKIHTKVLGNHSLWLQNVKEDKQGYYLCQASNGIGNAIGKVIQVNVKCKWSYKLIQYIVIQWTYRNRLIIISSMSKIASPLFSSTTRTVSTKEGDTATLQCNVTGDHPIEVKWFKNGKSDTMTTNKFR